MSPTRWRGGRAANCPPSWGLIKSKSCSSYFFSSNQTLAVFLDQNGSSTGQRFQTCRPVFLVKERARFCEALERGDFCLAAVVLRRLCCTGRCDFCMQASTVGVLQPTLKKPTRCELLWKQRRNKSEQPPFCSTFVCVMHAILLISPSFHL